jgi:hypothetical protein
LAVSRRYRGTIAYPERSASVTLAQLIYKISTNPKFASAFSAQPQLQLATVGAKLTEDERAALEQVLKAKEEGESLADWLNLPIWF